MSPSTTTTTSPLRMVPALPPSVSAQASTAPERSLRDWRVQFLMDRMTAHLNQSHSLPSLAALVELCPRQLGRLFKEETGQSPLQYLHDLRLAHACQLLVREFKNVQKIAEEVGFRQVGYFNRVFKACYGCTPSAYRRQSAGKKIAKKIA